MKSIEDYEGIEAPDESALQELSAQANELLELRNEINKLSAQIGSLSVLERKLSQELLPEKMKTLGVMEFKLQDGSKVSIKHKVKASLSAARREAGFEWLRENGYGSLIKERTVEETVHPATLSAFVREQLSQGAALPTTLFGVFEYDETEIKS